jgi:hypothetical protein
VSERVVWESHPCASTAEAVPILQPRQNGEAMSVHQFYLPDALNDPTVLKITDEFAKICVKYQNEIPELMSAIALIASSACKSFGVHPVGFTQNFERIYSVTEPGDEPAPVPGGARG